MCLSLYLLSLNIRTRKVTKLPPTAYYYMPAPVSSVWLDKSTASMCRYRGIHCIACVPTKTDDNKQQAINAVSTNLIYNYYMLKRFMVSQHKAQVYCEYRDFNSALCELLPHVHIIYVDLVQFV